MQAKFERDYLDATPQELREVCLNCSRPRCSGNCVKFDEAYRQHRNGNFVRNPKRHGQMVVYKGASIPLKDFSQRCGYDVSTVRRKLKCGFTVEEICHQAQLRKGC